MVMVIRMRIRAMVRNFDNFIYGMHLYKSIDILKKNAF